MRNARAVTIRILRQFKHDPRTIFMMIIAPVIAFFVLNTIFGSPDYQPLVLASGVGDEFSAALESADARVDATSLEQGLEQLRDGEADGMVVAEGAIAPTYTVYLEGTDPSKSGAVMRAIAVAIRETADPLGGAGTITLPNGQRIDIGAILEKIGVGKPAEPDVVYVHGSADMRVVDYYGPVFIGVFVFFFVFITSGISFVRERTGGTLERIMATPIRRFELVLGYVQGFGLFSLIQTVIVAWASIYWVGFPNLGSFWLVLLTAESMAVVSLTLGILVSEYANTELQVLQLLQIIVIPQILLSGMFDLSQTPQWMQVLSRAFPITYGADAMRAVMLKGEGLAEMWPDLAVLWGFIALFSLGNVIALRKYRRV